jgi:hypothetical protein
MMAKYRYRIEAGNYGGELTIGEVSEAFVEYWKHEEQEDLIDAVTDFDDYSDEEPEDALQDPDSPPMLDSYWHDIDDLEHLNGTYSDGTWNAYSVPTDGSEDYDYENETTFEAEHMFSRECYTSDEVDEEYADQTVPVLAFHSSEKGSFACWFLDTDEKFDPSKVRFGSCETDLADLVESVYYGKEELEANYDYNDTTGKAYYARVGYVNRKWHDQMDHYTIEQLEEDGYFDE